MKTELLFSVVALVVSGVNLVTLVLVRRELSTHIWDLGRLVYSTLNAVTGRAQAGLPRTKAKK